MEKRTITIKLPEDYLEMLNEMGVGSDTPTQITKEAIKEKYRAYKSKEENK